MKSQHASMHFKWNQERCRPEQVFPSFSALMRVLKCRGDQKDAIKLGFHWSHWGGRGEKRMIKDCKTALRTLFQVALFYSFRCNFLEESRGYLKPFFFSSVADLTPSQISAIKAEHKPGIEWRFTWILCASICLEQRIPLKWSSMCMFLCLCASV